MESQTGKNNVLKKSLWGKCGENPEKKNRQLSDKTEVSDFCGTQTRGRTGMEMNPLVFETSASTDSAIWALAFVAAKVEKLFLSPKEKLSFF